tara:strand:- start:483 stop:3110 length:2628 start_codon:yes stop_codon:yes gene_type:complete
MKYLCTLSLVLLISNSLFAQRYIPLMEEGRTLTESFQGPNGRVLDMIVYNDKLLFGGQFDQINNHEIYSLGYWDGNVFSEFEVPLEDLYAIKSILDTPLGLVISGDFTTESNIKLLDGDAWVDLGEGLNGNVYDMLWFEGKLIACGHISSPGDTEINKIAVFENGAWSTMGDGFDDTVEDIIVFEEELYAVGDFYFSGNTEVNHLAKWNSTEWEAVFDGFYDRAQCLEIHNGELMIGGRLSGNPDQSISYNSIVKMTPTGFENLVDTELGLVGYMISQNEGLYVTPGFGGFSGLNVLEPSFLIKPDLEIKILNGPWMTFITEFQNSRFTNSARNNVNSFEGDYFQSSALGRLRINGAYSEGLETSQIKTNVRAAGSQFNEMNHASADYITAPFEDLSTIWEASLWIGGMTENDELQINAPTYHLDDFNRFFYIGPISNQYDNDYVDRYFRVWRVTAEEIENHIANYSNVDYIMPEAIQNWPGNGRIEHGESSHLAPFVDTDENGFYQPNQGDYPAIKGDVAVFNILSGSRGEALSQEGKTNCEIGTLIYGFQTEEEDIDHTVFIQYSILNKSSQNYTDFKLSYWMDGDIGSHSDDYVGCSPEQDLLYCYNGDSFDEATDSSPGYGANMPTQGVKLLNQPLSSHLYYHNGGGQNGSPETNNEFWNYMNSKWKNGQHVSYGGDGYQSGTDPDIEADFMFPSNPSATDFDPEAWNEITAGNNPGDRRQLGTTGNLNLGAGESVCVELALITAFSDAAENTNIASVEELLIKADLVQEYYDQNISSCNAPVFPLRLEETEPKNNLVLYPNPASGSIRISGVSTHKVDVTITDLEGRIILSQQGIDANSEIDIQSISKGLYIVSIWNDGALSTTEKLVKN